jgi:acyl-CoA thioesterase FadM
MMRPLLLLVVPQSWSFLIVIFGAISWTPTAAFVPAAVPPHTHTTTTSRKRLSPSFGSSSLEEVSVSEIVPDKKEEEVTAEKEGTVAIPLTTFTSPPMRVYIEDTDAYGIMYNSNYLRSFDRALHMSTTQYNTDRIIQEGISGQHEGWSLLSVGQERFGQQVVLGDEFQIHGQLKHFEDMEETWDMQMTSPDGSITYNWVKDVKVHVSNDEASLHSSLAKIQAFDREQIKPDWICHADTFTVYRDEIDAHWQGHLPLRNVLNLFERSRTLAIGGPDGLKRWKEDSKHPVVVVVTNVSGLTLVDEGADVKPGQAVAVETAISVKRRGMVLECYQTLKTTGDVPVRLAQGKVTLVTLDANTRKPTSKLPEKARQLLQLVQ